MTRLVGLTVKDPMGQRRHFLHDPGICGQVSRKVGHSRHDLPMLQSERAGRDPWRAMA
jgi:hypothetical protein